MDERIIASIVEELSLGMIVARDRGVGKSHALILFASKYFQGNVVIVCVNQICVNLSHRRWERMKADGLITGEEIVFTTPGRWLGAILGTGRYLLVDEWNCLPFNDKKKIVKSGYFRGGVTS